MFLSGVGNSILFLPIIEALKNNLKNVEIDIVVGNKAVHDIFQILIRFIFTHMHTPKNLIY